MLNYYIPKHFRLEEFVDRQTFIKFQGKAWKFIDPRLVCSADGLRDYFGVPVTINNWMFGGDKEWRGLRLPASPNYSPYSQHSMGRAIDAHIDGVTAEEARVAIIANKDDDRFKYIMRLEDDVSWLHMDTGQVSNRIHLFKP